jgi:hypothetical protein
MYCIRATGGRVTGILAVRVFGIGTYLTEFVKERKLRAMTGEQEKYFCHRPMNVLPPVRKLRLKPLGMNSDPIDLADATNKKKYQIRPEDVLEVESGAIIITRANGARIVFPLRIRLSHSTTRAT